MNRLKYTFLILLSATYSIYSQSKEGMEENIENLPVREYTLTIKKEKVNKAGKEVMGMTVNGSIPGPTLRFNEGEFAIIHVKNEMDVETSVHWHGILIPNYYDGVPYLTTPPIKPGTTFTYKFPLRQSGTYWYHSHTMLQEQSGVFGSLVIEPEKKTLEYDKELVLMLSDWTNEKPLNVLRNLKRRNEWYGIKKGTSTPLNEVIGRKALGAQLNFWKQRMEGADIADVYYPAFLINGQQSQEYPDLKPGEKVRLRIINGSASTSFWMDFGAQDPLLVSADGIDVVPVKKNKTFIAVAETYDYIVTIPQKGKMEFKIMAQDGSGTASAYLGSGEKLPAPKIPKPDKIEMMKEMAKMDMKMGAPALKFRPGKDDRYKMAEKYGMHMKGDMDMNSMKPDMKESMQKSDEMNPSKMEDMDMNQKNDGMDHMKMDMPMDSMKMDHMGKHANMDMPMDSMKMDHMGKQPEMDMEGMDMFSEYNYDYLKSPTKTTYDKDVPVKEILLNLTGNMNRYIWSLNGVPLSESDDIEIKGNEVTRVTLNNLTMMHHPMHLHGHFFRVINKNGEYSPLKHTVNVPPMEKVTIEFYGNDGDEYGDWFFHCHILYHMMAGMARVFSYDTPRDPRLKGAPVSKLLKETDKYYSWGTLDVASHMTGLNLVSSNIRNQFNINAEYGWNQNMEAEITYERYLQDYFRIFGGVNMENEFEDSLDKISTTAIIGIRYLTPYLFNLDVRMDSKLRPQISLSREIMIFPRTMLFGNFEYRPDFGWVDDLPVGKDYNQEITWSVGAEYFLLRNLSLMASYDNRFGVGGGLSARF